MLLLHRQRYPINHHSFQRTDCNTLNVHLAIITLIDPPPPFSFSLSFSFSFSSLSLLLSLSLGRLLLLLALGQIALAGALRVKGVLVAALQRHPLGLERLLVGQHAVFVELRVPGRYERDVEYAVQPRRTPRVQERQTAQHLRSSK